MRSAPCREHLASVSRRRSIFSQPLRTGGFRKLRWSDARRGKGKRGGLRVIYYWLLGDGQFWMFAIYDKDELENLTADQEKVLKQAITQELNARGTQ